MNTEEQVNIMSALAKVGRPPMLEHFGPRSCIAATRIGLDVLDYFGVPAQPLPLFVLLMNDEALTLHEQGMSQQDLTAEMQKYGMNEPGGPWAMGLGAEIENSKDWAGHLVIALPQVRCLLDLSLDQASRPHKGLPIEPVGHVFPLVREDDWWEGRRPRTGLVGERGERRMMLVFDRDAKDPHRYKRTANWRRDSSDRAARAVFREVTGRIIRLVKDELSD